GRGGGVPVGAGPVAHSQALRSWRDAGRRCGIARLGYCIPAGGRRHGDRMTQRSVGTVEPGLAEFLAARARGASGRRLVADAVGGVLVVVAMLVWRPSWWLLVLLAGLCFAAFGFWGIL